MISYKISLLGGSLTSIIVDNEEMVYQPTDPRAWQGQDIVIFPFVARLKNKTYSYEGKEYHMKNHGLARYNYFKIIEKNENKTSLLFESNEDTLKEYPFHFKLYVHYEKYDYNNSLKVTYIVQNLQNKTMFFGIGGHLAMKVNFENEDMSGNYIIFDRYLELYYYSMDANHEFINKREYFGKVDRIEISKSFFQIWNTLILDAKDIHSVTLLRKDGKKVIYNFENINFLVLWSHPFYGDYVCVEPWMSLPDFIDCSKDLKSKPFLMQLKGKKKMEFSFTYSFEMNTRLK